MLISQNESKMSYLISWLVVSSPEWKVESRTEEDPVDALETTFEKFGLHIKIEMSNKK